jgi:hypothetical protein
LHHVSGALWLAYGGMERAAVETGHHAVGLDPVHSRSRMTNLHAWALLDALARQTVRAVGSGLNGACFGSTTRPGFSGLACDGLHLPWWGGFTHPDGGRNGWRVWVDDRLE